MKIDLCKLTENARYSEVLDSLLKNLGVKKILDIRYESDYQGFVDVSALLKDGRVFSYLYYYGSCSGCDDWEDRSLSDEKIEAEMKQEGTFFKSVETYEKYKKVRKSDR